MNMQDHSSMQPCLGNESNLPTFHDWNIQSDNTRVKIMKPWEDVFHQVENNLKDLLKDAKVTENILLPAKEIIPVPQEKENDTCW